MAKATNLKFGMLIDNNEYYSKNAKLGTKGVWPGHVAYFSILGSLNISGTAKATNFQKLSVGMTGISGQILHRGPAGEPIVSGGQKKGSWGALPPLETEHICIPVSQFCLQFCSRTF